MNNLNTTVSADRPHIGFFGLRNAGKSSVVNAVTGQNLSLVSDVKGTTTDPVQKAMELLPLGPVVIIDTPGMDDEGELGEMRVHRARQVLAKTDIAVLVVDAVRGLQPQDEAAMVGYLYLFIAALMRETSESRPHSTSSSSQYVLNAIKYIQFNYSHDISIDDVAKSVGVSRSHLYRVFMLNVGKSPIDYLTEYRVNEACKLLRSGTLSIAEVAASVGFLDQFYFSRVFKRAKGVPPSKYMTSQADADVQPAPDET